MAVRVWLRAYEPRANYKVAPVEKASVSIEFTNTSNSKLCYSADQKGGTPVSHVVNFKGDATMAGWIILHGKARDPHANYHLSFTLGTKYSPLAANTVNNITGSFQPYKVELMTGRGLTVVGGSIRLVS